MSENDLKIRNKFPIFSQKVHGHDFVYFDSASTAQMPEEVLQATVDYYTKYKSNVGRGIYEFAECATKHYEDARQKVAQFINAKKNQILFTSGATESINLVAQAWAANHIKSGDEIVISAVEHHSNFVPWQQFAIQLGAKLVVVPVNKQGFVDSEIFKKYLSSKTKLVSIVHTSNVTGATNDVATLTRMAHAVGAKVLIDAAQSVVHQKVDVQSIGCDFLVFSGHKLFGPTGVGVLYVASDLIQHLDIAKFGGGMVFSVGLAQSTFKEFPHCFEAGTPNVAGVIGLGAAIDFVQKNIDFVQLQKHETALVKKLLMELSTIDHIKVISFIPETMHDHTNIVTFYSTKHHAHDIAAHLDRFGIAVRAGHHCVQLFHEQQNLNASVRVSFSVYNTMQEVEYFVQRLKQI